MPLLSSAASRARRPIVAVFVVIVTIQLALAAVSLDVLSAVRAYVAGESLYSKGQKDAHIHLLGYLADGHEADHEGFLRALAVPRGDRSAREALEQRPAAIEAARHGFLAGGNHADDIDGMIRLFVWFRHLPFMARPIATWTEADALVHEMAGVGARAHELLAAGALDESARAALRQRAGELNLRLSALEVRFSEQLGEAARRTQALLVGLNIGLAALLTLTGLAFVRYSARVQARAQAALDVGDLRVARLVQAVNDGVLTLDADDRIVFCNRAAERIFGLRSAAVLGQPVSRYIEIEPPGFGACASVGLVELVGRRADASAFPIEASVSRLETDTGRLVTIVLRDVTEQHAARRERRAREALEAASRAKTEFLSRMSHELRTPLNAVLGFAQLLRVDQRAPPTHEQLERIEHIECAGAHLLALVDDVLDLSRVEAGRMAVTLEPVDLRQVVAEALGMLEALAGQHGVRMCPDVVATAAWVAADRVRLRQVIVNLVSNAIKYNRRGGAVTLSIRSAGDRCELSVVDTGRGIAPDQLHRLFEPFNRLGAEKSSIEGTGIGLVLSRRLAQLMRGSLHIDSQVGRGTAATLTLRAAEPAVAAPCVPGAPGTVASEAGTLDRRVDVLYAEDDEVNAELVRQMLGRRCNVVLRVAPSGAQALQMARERVPDLMLVDMNLGDMTGLQLGRQLRALAATRAVPLVALSADALPEQIAVAMANGFARYLTKPVNQRELLLVLDGVAEGAEPAAVA
jgi:PAS domain S-box-containing protein